MIIYSSLYIVIDANLNRAKEGLRVIEDICRFILVNAEFTEAIKTLRHSLAHAVSLPDFLLVQSRESDAGAERSVPVRKNIAGILIANFRRSTEALRVLEECLDNGDDFKNMRYAVYQLEKKIFHTLRLKIPFENDVYVISSEVEILKKAIQDGSRIVQLRDKESTPEIIYQKALEMVDYVSDKDAIFILNDDPGLGKRVGAHGVHIGQDTSIELARSIVGPNMIIGKTTHSLEQGLQAEKEGANYVSVGPIYATPTKPDRAAIGLDYIREARVHLAVPFVTIGGIDLERLPEILAAGASTIGIVRAAEQVPEMLRMMHEFN